MENDNMMLEILKQYQRKYSITTEIFRLTEEMGELLSKNDQVSAQLVLNMRQDEMDRADKCDAALATLEDALSADERQRLLQIVEKGQEMGLAETFEEKKIIEINGHIKQNLQKTIELDKRISSRIAGKDSYYASQR